MLMQQEVGEVQGVRGSGVTARISVEHGNEERERLPDLLIIGVREIAVVIYQ